MNTFTAFLQRELHAALLNRLILFFSAAALLAGLVPLMADTAGDRAQTAAYTLLQATLFLIPLFSLLIGAGSAQSEADEQAFLMSQPCGRGARVLGKFTALWLVIALAALLMVIPAAFARTAPATLIFLWLHAAGAGGVFVALGLAIGFSTRDRVQAHMIALCAWFVFLAGGDLLALALAPTSAAQRWPDAWVALLMLNPLDALRVGALFSLDRVPFDLASAPPLGRWWLENLALWFAAVAAAWIAAALFWSRLQLQRMEA